MNFKNKLVVNFLLQSTSVRLNERKQKDVKNNKKMAYLIDLKTVSISELNQSNMTTCYK